MPKFAAVDIGSNSIRMEAAETIPGSAAKLLTSDRQVTRLGASVFRTGKISADAIELVCKVLAGMAQQYRKLDIAATPLTRMSLSPRRPRQLAHRWRVCRARKNRG